MPHDLCQFLRLRYQRSIELREALPLSDPIHRIESLSAEYTRDTGLYAGRKSLPLPRDFPQPGAACGFFFDQRARQFARKAVRKSKGFATSLALEHGIFQRGGRRR